MLVSIITPTLDESRELDARAAELAQLQGPWEWIVVDGGSTDGTAAHARTLGARVVRSVRGRGPQLNRGARVAKGDVLLFLHADTRLPEESLRAVRRAIAAGSIGGNFELAFDGATALCSLATRYYAFQRHVLRVYYGDSAIFVRRDVFERLGGFPDYPIMEDYALVEKLEQEGATTCLPLTVSTSSRRYRDRVGRTILSWIAILGLYRLGVSPHWLGKLYPAIR